MSKLTIELTGLEEESIAEAIINAAARQMLEAYVPEEDGEKRRLVSALSSQIQNVIREEAQEAAPGIVAQILADKVVQTDDFGYAKGEPKPVAAIIAEEVKRELQHRSGRSGPTVLDRMIRDEVDRVLAGELRETIAEAKRVVSEAVSERAVEELRKAVASAL